MTFVNDWALLQAAAADLPAYLLSKEIYWPAQRVSPQADSALTPQLSIGNILLSQARISALALDVTKQAELSALNERIAHVRAEWRANWGRKAALEYTWRLNQWRQYLSELRSDSPANVTAYPSQVRQRTMLRLLATEILPHVPEEELAQIARLDALLHDASQPGAFVWEAEIAAGFPAQDYWYLYIRIS